MRAAHRGFEVVVHEADRDSGLARDILDAKRAGARLSDQPARRIQQCRSAVAAPRRFRQCGHPRRIPPQTLQSCSQPATCITLSSSCRYSDLILVRRSVVRHSRHVFGGVLALALSALATSAPALGDVTHSVVVSQTPVAWTPQVRDGRVQAITQVGNQIIVGGDSQVKTAGGAVIAPPTCSRSTRPPGPSTCPSPRRSPAARCSPSSRPVTASVYAAGRFVMVNGRQQRGLVELRVADGSTDRTFCPGSARAASRTPSCAAAASTSAVRSRRSAGSLARGSPPWIPPPASSIRRSTSRLPGRSPGPWTSPTSTWPPTAAAWSLRVGSPP